MTSTSLLIACAVTPVQPPTGSEGYSTVGFEYALVHDSDGCGDGSEGVAGHVQLGQGWDIADCYWEVP